MYQNVFRILRRLAFPLLACIILVTAVTHTEAIADWVKLYNYTAPPAVAQLADQTAMTAQARKLFYINHPEIDDRDAFNTACSDQGEQTIILGCYHAIQQGIYVFSVGDVRLDGVQQVTAAHEMLHAAYDRLGKSEREEINSALQTFYETKVTDERIKATMAAYEKSEPKDVVNEMHSIFGTEIANLTPELESYYQQYFSDRTKVVRYAQAYQSEFTGRTSRVKAYDSQLSALKTKIDTNTAELKDEQSDISAMRRRMDADRSSGDFEAYNAQVGDYNARIESYNRLVRLVQDQIAEYNKTVAERNSLALEVRDLTRSIDSKVTPINQ